MGFLIALHNRWWIHSELSHRTKESLTWQIQTNLSWVKPIIFRFNISSWWDFVHIWVIRIMCVFFSVIMETSQQPKRHTMYLCHTMLQSSFASNNKHTTAVLSCLENLLKIYVDLDIKYFCPSSSPICWSLRFSLLPSESPAVFPLHLCPIFICPNTLLLLRFLGFFSMPIVHFYKTLIWKNTWWEEWGQGFSVVWFSIWVVLSLVYKIIQRYSQHGVFSFLFITQFLVVFPLRMTTSKAGLLPSL